MLIVKNLMCGHMRCRWDTWCCLSYHLSPQALLKGFDDVEAVKQAGTRASRTVPSTLVVRLLDHHKYVLVVTLFQMEKSGIKTRLSVKQSKCCCRCV